MVSEWVSEQVRKERVNKRQTRNGYRHALAFTVTEHQRRLVFNTINSRRRRPHPIQSGLQHNPLLQSRSPSIDYYLTGPNLRTRASVGRRLASVRVDHDTGVIRARVSRDVGKVITAGLRRARASNLELRALSIPLRGIGLM